MTFSFSKPVPKKYVITQAADSWHGAVIAYRDKEFGALCGDCFLLLGWRYTEDREGFWSCMEGCKKKYGNSLGKLTSSVSYREDPLLNQWVGGWLGITDSAISVDFEEDR